MAEVNSIQKALLNDTANFVAGDIAYVLINDSIKITEFRTKQVTENVVTVEYELTEHMTDLMTNIKMMSADNKVLSQATVYVPVTQLVIGKHTLTVKEGI